MFIYFAVILFCFLLSTVKLPKSIENSALILIAFFLCFGYTTGTDWYAYEQFYNNRLLAIESSKTGEFGYFYLQTLIGGLGVGFWIFHIAIKLLVFYSLISFVRRFDINLFLFLALFIPEAGLYLFIDCPFRNLIALGISLIAYNKLFDNKTLSYFIYVFIAMTFHVTAIIMIPIYFVYKKDIKITFAIISTVIIYSFAFNIDFLISNIYTPLIKISPTLGERLEGYLFDSRFISDKINAGSFIRLFILFILLLFKEKIISGDKYRSYILNLSILFLIFYPLGVSLKVFQRFTLFLFPFYTLSILYLLKSLEIKTNKYILTMFFVLFSFMQTYKTVSMDFRYVPYTNYMIHSIKQDFQSIDYRYQYNRKHSPYKKL